MVRKHPANEALLAYCDADPEARAVSPVREHLEGDSCAVCLRKVRIYEEILESLAAPRLDEAPRGWIDAARRILLERGRASSPAPSAVQRAIARARDAVDQIVLTLVLDTRLTPALEGIRGGPVADARQILFEGGRVSLHLRLQSTSPGRTSVFGVFVPPEGTDLAKVRAVALLLGRTVRRRVASTGEFQFASLPTGALSLKLEVPEAIFLAGPIELRPE